MTWIDVSVPVHTEMVVYPGDPEVRIERVSSIGDGDLADVSRVELGSHTGTHVDAPAHFLEGAPGVDALPLGALIGPAVVVDAAGVTGDIDAAALRALEVPADAERVLLRTRDGRLWEPGAPSAAAVGVAEDAAGELVSRGVCLVGIDGLSIAPSGDPAPTHLTLLRAGVVVLEGLDLRAVEPGSYTLVCLPLRLAGADGSPARALLGPSGLLTGPMLELVSE